MEKNLLKEFHDNSGKTYKHLTNTVNLILRKDLNSNYRTCKSTLENYANGTTVPSVKDIITAIAKMLKVEPNELMKNLREFNRKVKNGNNPIL